MVKAAPAAADFWIKLLLFIGCWSLFSS